MLLGGAHTVERRMAPLSKRLAGVILPHEHFGSHLDDKGMTTDDDLEKRNFQHAGETLAEVWRDMKIDNYDVSAGIDSRRQQAGSSRTKSGVV
ncbi:hypothetical protein EVAR_17347_1 [Eumeta japonica]|uniref:Uncharacterized protein n=1 Tax=Eumeta variegata TaxID=151549 RepID=A0A4C1WF79_EUMVA|nr:hypothetical protein EVAR_17347_1 [Eumeta japonica]